MTSKHDLRSEDSMRVAEQNGRVDVAWMLQERHAHAAKEWTELRARPKDRGASAWIPFRLRYLESQIRTIRRLLDHEGAEQFALPEGFPKYEGD